MLVPGGLDDQLTFLIWSKASAGVFRIASDLGFYSWKLWGFVTPWKANRPLLALVSSLLGSFFGMSSLYLLLLLGLLLSLSVSLKFFRSWKFSFFYTLIFVFSSYMWVHYDIHLPLAQLWLIPLFLLVYSCVKRKSWLSRGLLLGLCLSFSIAISNYIGYFTAVYLTLFLILRSLLEKDALYIKELILVGVFSVLLALTFLFPYLHANYSSGMSPSEADVSHATVHRPYEDFFHFSSRPWYFFIPPVKNPWLGGIAQKAVDKIASTNYFLADDYFAGEHSANYFGLAFLATVTVLSVIMLRTGTNEKKKQITFYWVLNFLLYLFMLPPFFTISGIKIYTPGELMYRFFPMFRVTTRMAPLLLLNFLIILATSVDYLSQQSEKYKRFFKFFIPILTLVTLAETFIPPKIVYYDEPPRVYSYLGEVAPQEKFVVYPYSQADEAFFWVDAHRAYLMNVRGYVSEEYSAEELTKALSTEEGIAEARKLGAKYLVIYRDLVSEEEWEFFENSPQLELLEEFGGQALFKVIP